MTNTSVNKRYKVLILTYISAPYRADVFNELGKYFDVTVLFERNYDFNRPDYWFTTKFEHFKGFLLCNHDKENRKNIRLIENKMLHKEFDVILLYEYSTPKALFYAAICRFLRIPYFINGDGAFINKNPIKGLVKRFSIKKAAGFFASGQMSKNYFEYYGAKKENIYFHPFTSLFAKDIFPTVCSIHEKEQLRNEFHLTGEKIAITVSRFIPSKKVDLLIKSWSQFPGNFQLIIVGAGDLEEEYKNQVKKLGLTNITFPGFLEKETLMKYLRAADLFVLPTETDTWGLVINEAMACGLPVITTNMCVAGIELIRNGENGFLIPVGDQNALFNAMNIILTDDNLRMRMAITSLMSIQSYTYENVAKSHKKNIDGYFIRTKG